MEFPLIFVLILKYRKLTNALSTDCISSGSFLPIALLHDKIWKINNKPKFFLNSGLKLTNQGREVLRYHRAQREKASN